MRPPPEPCQCPVRGRGTRRSHAVGWFQPPVLQVLLHSPPPPATRLSARPSATGCRRWTRRSRSWRVLGPNAARHQGDDMKLGIGLPNTTAHGTDRRRCGTGRSSREAGFHVLRDRQAELRLMGSAGDARRRCGSDRDDPARHHRPPAAAAERAARREAGGRDRSAVRRSPRPRSRPGRPRRRFRGLRRRACGAWPALRAAGQPRAGDLGRRPAGVTRAGRGRTCAGSAARPPDLGRRDATEGDRARGPGRGRIHLRHAGKRHDGRVRPRHPRGVRRRRQAECNDRRPRLRRRRR